MRGFAAVAWREIKERRAAVAAAAVLAALPFLGPVLPAVRHYGAAEVRLYVAAFLAIAFAAVLSLVFGAMTIGRDLSERRLAFYFVRPVSSAAVWAGKLAGVWLLIVLSTAVILLPAGLFDFSTWWRESRSAGLAGNVGLAFAFAVVVFLAVGNAVSLAFRSRSLLVVGDLICLALWAFAMWWICLPLLLARAGLLIERTGITLAMGIAAAFLAAGGAQVALGRIDSIRGNRARFATLWGALFALAAGCAGYVLWLRSATPASLRQAWIVAGAPRGGWIAVEGRARGRADFPVAFLYDTLSERFVRVSLDEETTIEFSADGKSVIWNTRTRLDEKTPREIWICRLDVSDPKPTPTRIQLPSEAWNFVSSADGHRLAALDGNSVSVYEIASGKLLASAILHDVSTGREGFGRLFFVQPDRLRVDWIRNFSSPNRATDPSTGEIRILDFDLGGHRLTLAGSIESIPRPFYPSINGLSDRIIVWRRGRGVDFYDGSNGVLLKSLGPGPWDSVSRRFLPDGRLSTAQEDAQGVWRIRLFSRNGEQERAIEIGQAARVVLGGEPVRGEIVVAVARVLGSQTRSSSAAAVAGPFDAFLLNLDSGSLRKIGSHLEPVASSSWRFPLLEPGSGLTNLFIRGDGAIVRRDPETGASKVLFSAPER